MELLDCGCSGNKQEKMASVEILQKEERMKKRGFWVFLLLAIAILCFISTGVFFQHLPGHVFTAARFTFSSNGRTAYHLDCGTNSRAGFIFITGYAPRDDKDFALTMERIIALARRNGFGAGYQSTEGSPTQKILLQCNYVSDFKSLLLDLMGSFYDVRVECIK